MKEQLFEFWESLGERCCLVTTAGHYYYAEMVTALRQANTQKAGLEFSWGALLGLLQAAVDDRAFSFDKGENHKNLAPGLWLQTTGTTGEPKWVNHSWETWLAQYRWKDGGERALLQVMAFDHIGGLHSIFSALSRGMTMVVPAAKDGITVQRALQEHQVYLLPTTPAHLALLLQTGCFDAPLPHLRLISYGAEAMSPALKQRISFLQPHIRWRETYGSTETGILSLKSGAAPGIWLPNFQYQIIEGELHAQNLNGEWVATGDFVQALADGKLRFLGRKATRVKIGGVLVAPEQVAAWLRKLPDVWQAEVGPVANPILGQVLEARLWVSESTDTKALEKQIRSNFPSQLPKEAQPVRYRFENQIKLNERMKREE